MPGSIALCSCPVQAPLAMSLEFLAFRSESCLSSVECLLGFAVSEVQNQKGVGEDVDLSVSTGSFAPGSFEQPL